MSVVNRELHEAALAMGYEYIGREGPHPKYRHVTTGEIKTIPGSSYDGPIKESVLAQLRRKAGLSKQGQQPVEGERRKRKPKRKGANSARLAELARQRALEEALAQREFDARLRELARIRRLMTR